MRLGKVIREFHAVPAALPGHPFDQEEADAPNAPGSLPVERGVLGWRFWRLETVWPAGCVLRSASARYTWQGPGVWDSEPPAVSLLSPRHVLRLTRGKLTPDGLRMGFHAFKSPQRAASCAWGLVTDSRLAGVYGPCELLGHTVEHEDGYRAQGMAVRSLYVASCAPAEVTQRVMRDLERRYACAVSHAVARPEGGMPARLLEGPLPRGPMQGRMALPERPAGS